MTIPVPIQKHLQAWRIKRGLSQEQVANTLGLTKGTLSRWESGERGVDLKKLSKLAEVYGVDPLALLMAPDDIAMATKLTEAKRILEHAKPGVAETWIETGRHMTGLPERDPSNKPEQR